MAGSKTPRGVRGLEQQFQARSCVCAETCHGKAEDEQCLSSSTTRDTNKQTNKHSGANRTRQRRSGASLFLTLHMVTGWHTLLTSGANRTRQQSSIAQHGIRAEARAFTHFHCVALHISWTVAGWQIMDILIYIENSLCKEEVDFGVLFNGVVFGQILRRGYGSGWMDDEMRYDDVFCLLWILVWHF